MKDKNTRTPHPGEIELCLCHRCASAYYSIPNRRISRVNMQQTQKDLCSLCAYRMGYDFYVWPVSKVPQKQNVRIRTFAEGGRDG